MKISFLQWIVSVSIAWISLCGPVRADGLNELKEALTRYPATNAIKAQVDAKTWKRDRDGKNDEEKSGQATLYLEDNAQGLRVQYSKDALNRYSVEEKAREKNTKANTPTLSALAALNLGELRQLTNAAPSLMQQLERSTFKDERIDTYNGKQARLLSFDYGIGALSEKDRKYLKKYDGSLEVWIAADGTPLASRTHQTLSGRAYVVVSFDMKNDEELVYHPIGDRLTVARKESNSSGNGMGEHGESKTTRSLRMVP